MRVIIIGAGLGGLCLAHGLRKAAVDVQVFEKQKENSDNLAGYGIHIDANGKNALRNCLPHKNWTRFESASISAGTQMFFRDTNLRLLAERDDAKVSGIPARRLERRGIGRVELRDILLDGLNDPQAPIVHWNKAFTHYSHLPNNQVRVHFADGTTEDGDVVVGADGARSGVRQQRLPHIQRLDLGIHAIAGRCALNAMHEAILPADLVNGSLNNVVPHGKGWMFVSSWNLPTSEHRQLTSGMEHHHVWAYVVPQTDIISEMPALNSEELREIVLRGIKGWSPGLKTVVQDSDASQITCIPLRSMPFLDSWTPSNVTVLGDAIHNMTPMAGVGANTALRDAELLTDMLTQADSGRMSIIDAIGTYESEMRLYANQAVGLSRRNAESASSGQGLQRWMFRTLLRVAQASPTVMRATLGRTVVVNH